MTTVYRQLLKSKCVAGEGAKDDNMPTEKEPSTWPLLISVIVTTSMGLLWVYAGTGVRHGQQPSPAVEAAVPSAPSANSFSREACEKLRRDIANDAVEFDPERPADVAMLQSWDADCRARHGFAILK